MTQPGKEAGGWLDLRRDPCSTLARSQQEAAFLSLDVPPAEIAGLPAFAMLLSLLSFPVLPGRL